MTFRFFKNSSVEERELAELLMEYHNKGGGRDKLHPMVLPQSRNGDNRHVLSGHWFARKGGVDWFAQQYELRNLREGIQKLQVQNWRLSQSNSQFLGEIILAKTKVKALHHEVTCKDALLKYKCCELERGENSQQRNTLTSENVLYITDEDSSSSPRPFVPNRRRFIRSKSLGASTEHKIEAEKLKSETKRRQSRRRSARVRSATQELTENLFEIEDLQLTMPNHMESHAGKKEEVELRTRRQDFKVHGRAAEKIHPYKEVSLVTKMRRS
ncbi:PREDICTED: shugoshin-1-like [Camelina sativa]|uniref:Shugoshin-1-like n=1 Tax=Camelina sativa TaxID=90675 RepID=A0ABM0SKN5_CAMSA|nr:PREDICTED: shugoshin-1-like [Camelina sativa]